MYESYEELMERKLAMTQDKRDRRQGSLIFDAMRQKQRLFMRI